MVAEDSDRLQALLAPATALAPAQPPAAPRQDPTGAFAAPAAFQAAMRTTFQQSTVTALVIPPETVVMAQDQRSVTFLEVESTLDPLTVAFAVTAVEVPGPVAGAVQRLAATRGQVQGTCTAI